MDAGDETPERKPIAEDSGPKKAVSRKQFSDKTERLIDWNMDVLLRLLQQIMARHDANGKTDFDDDDDTPSELTNPFDEVKEIISLPEFKEARKQRDPDDVKIPDAVVSQLRDFVSNIAALYNENPFHNFEHVRTILNR